MSDKIRVTIYIDGGIWGEVKLAALHRSILKKESVSASELVSEFILFGLKGSREEPKGKPLIDVLAIDDAEILNVTEPVSDVPQEAEILAKAQAKLDAERARRNIKTDKIESLKSTGFFNPQPKKK